MTRASVVEVRFYHIKPMLDHYSVAVAETTPGALEGSLIHEG
jgi:hypothetical protein